MGKLNLQEFLNSGLLELYLIGSLMPEEIALVELMRISHPEVLQEMKDLELFHEQDAMRHAVKPNPRIDQKMELIFTSLLAEQKMQLSETPLITSFSSSNDWLELISPLLPTDHAPERFEKLLRNNNGIMQVLVVSHTHIEEEIHEDVMESFLILKGSCVCTIGDQNTIMGPGDFMEIPLHLPHDVRITSKSVTAILQHVDC